MTIGILAVIALVSAFTVPVIPEKLASGVWTEEEFESLKPQIEEAAEKLNQMTFTLTEAGYDPPETFNLVGKSGHTDTRRALMGSWVFGSTRQSTWAFGTWMLPGVPHLEYDREERTVQVTPENVQDFLDWAESATEYPDAPNITAKQDGSGQPATRSESK